MTPILKAWNGYAKIFAKLIGCSLLMVYLLITSPNLFQILRIGATYYPSRIHGSTTCDAQSLLLATLPTSFAPRRPIGIQARTKDSMMNSHFIWTAI